MIIEMWSSVKLLFIYSDTLVITSPQTNHPLVCTTLLLCNLLDTALNTWVKCIGMEQMYKQWRTWCFGQLFCISAEYSWQDSTALTGKFAFALISKRNIAMQILDQNYEYFENGLKSIICRFQAISSLLPCCCCGLLRYFKPLQSSNYRWRRIFPASQQPC